MMDAPTFDATKFVRPAFLTIALYFSIIVVASMTMVSMAHATGSVPPAFVSCSNYEYLNNNNGFTQGGFTTAAAACAILPAGVGSYIGNGSYLCVGNINFVAVCMSPVYQCPANTATAGTPVSSTSTCACNDGYEPDSAGTSCVSNTCPVTKLADITDPVALLYENGTYNSMHPDLAHLNQATQNGLACIQQKVEALNRYMTPQPTSGYRPAAYQTHIYDVYYKWQKIQNNNTPECAEIKAAIQNEFKKHSNFAHAPGATSNHSQVDFQGNPAGDAVDISFVPQDIADAIACQCNMYRPLINMPNPKDNDPVHYQPRICPR